MKEYPEFSEEFTRESNIYYIPDSDGLTPEVLENIYVDMDIEQPRYGEGPYFSRVTKHQQDEKNILLVRSHGNYMLDKIMYEVK